MNGPRHSLEAAARNGDMDQALPEQVITISDSDRDSLWVLPLIMMPIENHALKQTKMVKNSNLESVIELFNERGTGKGHIRPDDLADVFSNISSADFNMIHTLSELKSYDVYSLRITLRQNGIEIENYDDLRLSDEKQHELQVYMRPFMEQIVLNLYGPQESANGEITDNWLSIFQHPDIRGTRKRLKNMAGKMDIPLYEIPGFIQEYGDAYLSVAYYRECLDHIRPTIRDFVDSAAEILAHQQLSQNYSLTQACGRIKTKVEKIEGALGQQFSFFGQSNSQMWKDMSAESFHAFRTAVHKNHTKMGGMMCALAIKMNLWTEKFPNREDGGPMRRADFILTDMGQGW